MAPTVHLRIGVFIPTTVQLLDLSPIDLLGMLDPAYLTACNLPSPIVSCGTPSTIHYISTPSNGTHMELTASASLKITKTILDSEVQPGMLDILLIPGPDPKAIFEEDVLAFLRGHVDWKGEGKKTDVLSVCTGVILLGQSGVLKGKTACGPRVIVPLFTKQFQNTTWEDKKRWVKDGNIWSSGGITNGQEMVAAYLREKFPGPVTEVVISMADVGEKGIEYTKGTSRETLWWLWQILKAMTVGNGNGKQQM